MVRSTLAAETMASSEVVDSGDLTRARIVESMQGIEYRSHEGYQKAMGFVRATGCKSLNGFANKPRTAPFVEIACFPRQYVLRLSRGVLAEGAA